MTLSLASLACFASLDAAYPVRRPVTPRGYDDGIHQKWEYRLMGGFSVGSYNDEALLFEAGVGYNFTSNVYLGAVAGVYPYFGVIDRLESCPFVPLLADLTLRSNPYSDRWSPFFEFRAGALLPMSWSGTLENGDTYDRQPYVTFELCPGINFRPVRNVDLRLSAGYALAIPGDDGYEPENLNHIQHSLQVRLGIGFRGRPSSPTRMAMIQESERVFAERQREYRERWEEQKARTEEEHRKEAEARAERRRQREQGGATSVLPTAILSSQGKMEFFCHVQPGTVAEGALLNNDLIRLATLVASKEVSSIVVFGYDPEAASQGNTDVIRANNNAEKVRSYLNKRYVIDRNILSTALSGFEDVLHSESRPSGTIATILIEKTPKPSQP